MSLELLDVGFRYSHHGPMILKGLSLEFTAPATALLGRNGAGKSTILSLLSTAQHPNSGSIRLDGTPVDHASIRDYRKKVAWLPQNIQAIPGFTTRESVIYAGWLGGLSTARANSGVDSVLEEVGLAQQSAERATGLSGGQLRRLGIAQALIRDVQWLLLDEPFAGLDPVERLSLQQLLQRLAQHVHMIVSTHQTGDLMDLFDTIVVIDHGDAIWRGTPKEFFSLVPQGQAQAQGTDIGTAAFASLVDRK